MTYQNVDSYIDLTDETVTMIRCLEISTLVIGIMMRTHIRSVRLVVRNE